MKKLAEIKKLAKAATPGFDLATDGMDLSADRKAAFKAAAGPQTVLAMAATIKRLTLALEFYGDTSNWAQTSSKHSPALVIKDDEEQPMYSIGVGGCKARVELERTRKEWGAI